MARGLFFLAVSAAGALALGPVYNKLIVGVSALLAFWAPHAIVTLRSATDVQGAVALLPVYQVALLLAMVGAFGRPIRWRPLLVALGVLATSQVLLLVGLGEVEAHAAVYPHALVLRGWAVILPVVLALLVLGAAGRTDATGIAARTAAYRTFWDSEFFHLLFHEDGETGGRVEADVVSVQDVAVGDGVGDVGSQLRIGRAVGDEQ